MKNLNRIISLFLVCFLAAGIVGCERTRTVSAYYTGSDEVESQALSDNLGDNTESTVSGKNTSSKGTTSKSGKSNTRSGNIW
ncbi:MAG: hypothetical protein J5662_08770 [Clostridia bacterium]|nr:hypothetical protein [Clostridia bacterium]